MMYINADRAIIGDGKTVVSPVWIQITDDKIAAISCTKPNDANEYNTTVMGAVTLTPGLFNCHEHLFRKPMPYLPGLTHKQNSDFYYMYNTPSDLLILALEWSMRVQREQGVCVARDMGLTGGGNTESFALRKALKMDTFNGLDALVCGWTICKTGGHGYKNALEVDGADAVMKAVRQQIRAGADHIKLMGSGGTEMFPKENPIYAEFTQGELDAAVCAAHDAGKAVAIHAYSKESIMRSLRAGIDSIEHGVFLDEECIELMIKKGTFLCPTMIGIRKPFVESPHFQDMCKLFYEPQIKGMRMAKEAGVPISIGTDTRGDVREEIRMVAEALDESPVEVLEHATRISALACNRSDLGLLEVGKTANIVAFEGDLTKSLDPLDHVVCVWKNGKALY